jgi:hypothetical protein
MVRASQLGSAAERRAIAAGLHALVVVARLRRCSPPFREVRHHAVLEQRDALVVLAGHLLQPAPVEVAVVAKLAWLLADRSSPVYAGGTDPAHLAELTSRCVDAVSGSAQR